MGFINNYVCLRPILASKRLAYFDKIRIENVLYFRSTYTHEKIFWELIHILENLTPNKFLTCYK